MISLRVIARDGVPDVMRAAAHAVCSVVYLFRSAQPNYLKKHVNEGVIPSRRFSYDETPSTTIVMRNPIVNVVTIITTFLIRIILHVVATRVNVVTIMTNVSN